MKKLSEHTLNRAVEYHIENQLPIYENVFRAGPPMHFKLLETIKEFYEAGSYEPLNEKDRIVTVLEGEGWQFQFDEQVPQMINSFDIIRIPKGIYHRLLIGSTPLKIKIEEV